MRAHPRRKLGPPLPQVTVKHGGGGRMASMALRACRLAAVAINGAMARLLAEQHPSAGDESAVGLGAPHECQPEMDKQLPAWHYAKNLSRPGLQSRGAGKCTRTLLLRPKRNLTNRHAQQNRIGAPPRQCLSEPIGADRPGHAPPPDRPFLGLPTGRSGSTRHICFCHLAAVIA